MGCPRSGCQAEGTRPPGEEVETEVQPREESDRRGHATYLAPRSLRSESSRLRGGAILKGVGRVESQIGDLSRINSPLLLLQSHSLVNTRIHAAR